MTRPSINFLVDSLAFLLVAALVGTGLLLHFRLPAGSGSASSLGLTRHEWGDVHFWIAVGFGALVAVHLLLHARWIKALTVGTRKGWIQSSRAWGGAVVAAIVLALAFSTLFWPVTPGTGKGRGEHATAGSDSADHEPGQQRGGDGGGRQRGRL